MLFVIMKCVGFLKNKFLLGCSDCAVGCKCLEITFKILSEVMTFFSVHMLSDSP